MSEWPFFYGLQPCWFTTDRLFKVFVASETICCARVWDEVGRASIQLKQPLVDKAAVGILSCEMRHRGFVVLAAKYGHTNLIARDWRKLAAFFESVFGCEPVPPERKLSGDAVERGSMVPDAALQGVHLRLPGYGSDGPTLEIFTYNTLAATQTPVANRPGFGHVAFVVSDVAEAVRAVIQAGGSKYGEVVTTAAGQRSVTWAYVRDPEDNLVELQSWSS